MQVVDGTAIDGTIALIDADGSALVYGTPTGARRATAPWPPAPTCRWMTTPTCPGQC